jgi:hypothetical protein
MTAPEGYCWLCSRFGKLTKEHIPPESAFNNFPLLFEKIVDRSRQTGVLEWAAGGLQQGLYFRSLCEECNNKYGRLYGGAYVDLVREIAERIGNVQQFHQLSLLGVKRPLAILKQVMLQFVTANGANFVRGNDWVAPFIRSRRKTDFPQDVFVYLFASNARMSRKTGVSSHIDLVAHRTHVTAEFTFWPLGTVMSFSGELSNKRLTPIHQWSQYPFDFRGSVDLHLSVNPVASAYPLDFRTASEVESAATTGDDPSVKRPSDEDLRGMISKATRVSGETGKDDWIYSGHPITMRKIIENKQTKQKR